MTNVPKPLPAESRCNLRSFSTVSRPYFHHIWLMRAGLFAIRGLENPVDTFLIPNSLGFFLAPEAQTSLAPGLLLVSH